MRKRHACSTSIHRSVKHEPQMPNRTDDKTWRDASVARMSEVFVHNRGLRGMYVLMATAHRYAIDYIEQAPVIVLAASNVDVSWTGRPFIQEHFRKMCESRASLRDVMHAYGLPLPLRLLDGRALKSTRATAIRRLALMNPSTLAQIIPTTQMKQNGWLEALQNWCGCMASRSGRNNYRCLFFEWAATNYPGITYTEARAVSQMVDFVWAHPDTFNPRWTLKRARAEEQKWHADRADIEDDEETDEDIAVPLDAVIDYTPLPLLWEHDGLRFVALQTGKALRTEGAAMRHCVASYWENVVEGGWRIYSIIENGRRIATLGLVDRPIQYNMPNATLAASVSGIAQRSRYQVGQLVGTRNSRPAPEIAKVVATFLAEINNYTK